MADNNAIVAVYDTHQDAQDAVNELRRAGFDMKKLSIIGRDLQSEQHVVGYYNAGDRMKYWGKLGALWGGLGGFLVGTAFFLVPGVGPVLIAGPLAAYIVSAVEGAVVVGGLSAIGGGLFSIGIPKNSVLKYEAALKADKFLLIAHSTRDEAQHARDIIRTTTPAEIGVHLSDAPEKTRAGGATV
jgi:hypothetical protein